MPTALQQRIKDEHKAVRKLVRMMKEKNWEVSSVFDGEERVKCRTEKEVMDTVFSVDESSITFHNKQIDRKHAALIVLGNSGAEVIADYGYNEDDDFSSIMDAHGDWSDKVFVY